MWLKQSLDYEWPDVPRGGDFNTGDPTEDDEDAEDIATADAILADPNNRFIPFNPTAGTPGEHDNG